MVVVQYKGLDKYKKEDKVTNVVEEITKMAGVDEEAEMIAEVDEIEEIERAEGTV